VFFVQLNKGEKMKRFIRYEDVPKDSVYLGSENPDGSIEEEIQNFIDDALNPIALFDKGGFYHFFDLGE
jgi:hypothetical protein